jgi:hypothetical protein
MNRAFGILVLCAVTSFVAGQDKPKDAHDLSPSEVIKRWNEAAAKSDMKTVAKLASKTTPKVVLDLIEQQFFLHYQGETKIVHEEISGDSAIVVHRIENRDAVFTAEIGYRMDLLVREDGRWKVTEQSGNVTLKPGKRPKSK